LNPGTAFARQLAALAVMVALCHGAAAHSASDAYLTLTAAGAGAAAGSGAAAGAGSGSGSGSGAAAGSGSRAAAGAAAPHARVLHGQWDIALRDLEFVLKLDDDGDGHLTWGEVRHHQPEIARYAYRYLHVDAGPGRACPVNPTQQMIDGHADGAYAALFFDVVCSGAPAKLTLHYDIFFSIDPSHRGIFVMHSGPDVATAVLSPQNARLELSLRP
jgi:hypothetical protein